MSLRSALLAATVAVLPIAAQAQPINGLYVGIGAGLNVMQQENGSIAAIGTSGSQQMSPGAAVVASMGWGFGNGLRAELEGDFRYNSVKSVSGYGSAFTSASGKENKYGVMVNALYDFDLGGVMPYVGAGVGFVAPEALRGHIGDSAHQFVGSCQRLRTVDPFGQAEIRHPDMSGGIDQHVRRFQIAMDDHGAVGLDEAVGDLGGEANGEFDVHAALEAAPAHRIDELLRHDKPDGSLSRGAPRPQDGSHHRHRRHGDGVGRSGSAFAPSGHRRLRPALIARGFAYDRSARPPVTH